MKEKLKIMSRAMLAVAAFVLVFGFGASSASAYGITQSAQTQDSVTVTWKPVTSDKSYNVTATYLGYAEDYETARNNAKAKQVSLPVGTSTYTFNGLKAGSSYEVYIYYDYTAKSTNKSYTGYSVASGTIKTLPGQVTGLNQERWYRFIHNLEVTWDRQTAADGYEYLFQTHKGKTIDSGTTRSVGFSESVKNYVVYKAQVRSYATINGTTYYGDWSPVAYFFTQPSKGASDAVVGAKISGSKLKVSWKKMDGVTGYNVFVSDQPTTGYKKVKSVKANKSSVVVKKLGKKKFKKNRTYYVYVQAYKKVGGVTFTTGVNYITNLRNNSTTFTYADSNGQYE